MPRYKHDGGDNCQFLATLSLKQGDNTSVYDLYYCPQSGKFPTIIARFGDDGPAYISGMVFAKHAFLNRKDQSLGSIAMGTGYYLAKSKGLIP